ncbi:MAG TPA: hypothetical protein VFW64_17710 [Pseudonocardiaceae bacterium]|nr:hypothetical protein [Pseudonocardiaceae bacterium]
MPASAALPIAVLAAHVGVASPTPDEDLLETLEAVPDPRRARGPATGW